ncbi:hypothetical protein B0H14DRAFT_2941837 [Mycena olivaceomarginata]|nr:hypothetical protein B0H14DRAFT_2941837 [Mycena olivaceomarginata]
MPEELQTEENLKVAQTAIPNSQASPHRTDSEVPAPSRPKIVIHLNGRLERADTDSEASADSNNALESYLDSLDDDEEDLDEDPDASRQPGETAFATTATYAFCPAPHRKQLLRIFIRHFCEHPLLPDRAGNTRTSDKISDTTLLHEVWAYMWTAWYSELYRHWRTTMSVENFWRNLKHKTLHHFVHPRLDQLIYLLAVDVVRRRVYPILQPSSAPPQERI